VKKQAHKILDERFPTKKALIYRIREIRDKYQDGEVLETYDLAFMLEILKTHPEYGQKAGAGIKACRSKPNQFGIELVVLWFYGMTGHGRIFHIWSV
jgi:hypothetical protein